MWNGKTAGGGTKHTSHTFTGDARPVWCQKSITTAYLDFQQLKYQIYIQTSSVFQNSSKSPGRGTSSFFLPSSRINNCMCVFWFNNGVRGEEECVCCPWHNKALQPTNKDTGSALDWSQMNYCVLSSPYGAKPTYPRYDKKRQWAHKYSQPLSSHMLSWFLVEKPEKAPLVISSTFLKDQKPI